MNSADGVEIAAYEFGGTGPPLVLAHATGFCATMYRPLGLHLVGRFRVVALDFRGHGRSARPEDADFGWDRMADDLVAAVERIGTPAFGFGHSMGGAALLLAEAGRPGTFAGMFLYEPIVFPDDFQRPARWVMADLARARRASFPSRDDALARYASRPPLNALRPEVLRAYVDDGFVGLPDGSVRLACLPDDEARTFESETKVQTSTVRDVASAVAICVGREEEGPNPARLGRHLATALPHAQLIERLELGHFGPFEAPELVAADITTHLGKIRRGG